MNSVKNDWDCVQLNYRWEAFIYFFITESSMLHDLKMQQGQPKPVHFCTQRFKAMGYCFGAKGEKHI